MRAETQVTYVLGTQTTLITVSNSTSVNFLEILYVNYTSERMLTDLSHFFILKFSLTCVPTVMIC